MILYPELDKINMRWAGKSSPRPLALGLQSWHGGAGGATNASHKEENGINSWSRESASVSVGNLFQLDP